MPIIFPTSQLIFQCVDCAHILYTFFFSIFFHEICHTQVNDPGESYHNNIRVRPPLAFHRHLSGWTHQSSRLKVQASSAPRPAYPWYFYPISIAQIVATINTQHTLTTNHHAEFRHHSLFYWLWWKLCIRSAAPDFIPEQNTPIIIKNHSNFLRNLSHWLGVKK